MLGMTSLKQPDAVHGEPSLFFSFEITDLDQRPPSDALGRGEPRAERRHVLRIFLEWVARRDQPPDCVEPKRFHRGEADVPVRSMRRIERSAEETDARHAEALAWASNRA